LFGVFIVRNIIGTLVEDFLGSSPFLAEFNSRVTTADQVYMEGKETSHHNED